MHIHTTNSRDTGASASSVTSLTAARRRPNQFLLPLEPVGLRLPQAAALLSLSRRAFLEKVRLGEFPSPRVFGRTRIWDRREIEAAFERLPRPGVATGWEDVA